MGSGLEAHLFRLPTGKWLRGSPDANCQLPTERGLGEITTLINTLNENSTKHNGPKIQRGPQLHTNIQTNR